MRAGSVSATPLGATASSYFDSSSGLSILRRTAPEPTSWPLTTGILMIRPSTLAAMSIRVLSASPCIISDVGRDRYQAERQTIANTTMATAVAAPPPPPPDALALSPAARHFQAHP